MNTSLPSQPPPDAPTPPPGPEARCSRKKAILIFVVLPAAILFVAFLLTPLFYRGPKAADRTVASINLKQVGLALIDFDSQYGRFPDASTIAAVKADTKTTLSLGTSSSNQLFRQLIATGVKSEKIFYAKSSQSRKKGDDVIHGVRALEKGECGITYVAGLSSSSAGDTPLLMTPVVPGTWEFDPKPLKGRAVVLFADQSLKFFTIDKHGHVIINGMNLFDPRQPYWNGKAPDIKWPE